MGTKGRYSYAVALADRGGHFCGGTMIASDVVLSAAHCVGGGSYNVVVGRHDLDNWWEGESIAKSYEIRHPEYSSSSTNNDFALIFLSRSTKEDVEYIKLNSESSYPSSGDSVHVMGYGDTNPSESITATSDKLRDVEVKVMSNEKCSQSRGYVGWSYQSYQGQITSQMLCAKDDNEDSCQGDSGGPLVVRGSDEDGGEDVQVGVVSWGIGCASSSFPGVYARVSLAYSWIKQEVCNRSSNPPESFNCSGESSEDDSENGPPPEPVSSPSPGSGGSNDGDDDEEEDCQNLNLELYTDEHATETSWALKKKENGEMTIVGSGPPRNFVYSDSKFYSSAASGCMTPGDYVFEITDSYGDGLTDNGYYELTLEGKVIAKGSSFGYSDVTEFTIGSSSSNTDSEVDDESSGWTELLKDDFESGYGSFNAGGDVDVKYYDNILGRTGVIRIENGNGMESSIYSDAIALDEDYSKIKVIFSFYANSMEFNDEFCLDYKPEGISSWSEQKCWSTFNFQNQVWYDDASWVIDLSPGENNVRVRFRCSATSENDDILFSSVAVQGI